MCLVLKRTSNCKHFQPRTTLNKTDEHDHSNDTKRQHRKLFSQLVHAHLQRSFSVFDLLHKSEYVTKLGILARSDDDSRAVAYKI